MKIERRFVHTGEIREDRVAILDGVKAGEKVVSEGQLKLQADARVRVDPNAELTPARGPAKGMRMSFTDIFIRRPVLASVVSLLILLVGLQCAFKLQVRQFPELSSTTITITTTYPGANADVVKGYITTPDRAGGGERRGHRHAGFELAAERLDDHTQSAA